MRSRQQINKHKAIGRRTAMTRLKIMLALLGMAVSYAHRPAPAWADLVADLAAQWPRTGVAEAGLDASKLQAPAKRPERTALDDPAFLPLDLAGFVGGLEPVIAIASQSAVRAYPLRIVVAHGVVND
ncbi:MAG: DUF3179 domain-containing protein, partial [Alphaproteobacteria bacterium]